MGMILNFHRVSSDDLSAFLDDSSLLDDYIAAVYDDESEYPNPALLDIDKAWDGISFVLRQIDPTEALAQTILSGTLVDEEQDFGCGPAHYLTSDEVAHFNGILSKISKADIVAHFNATKMMDDDIYPKIWEDEDALDYICDNFEAMQIFYAQAADSKQAIIATLG
jgi:hypothetical protein